jgi:uncharacterized GH25 family protein
MNTETTTPQVGTYKYHMARSVFWASKAEERTSKAVAKADMANALYHYNLATEARIAGK